MGAGGSNFPPEIPIIGQFNTYSLTGLTAAVSPAQTMFTAPISGLYLVGFAAHINSTNKAGSIAVTLATPHAGSIAIATQAGSGTITAIEQDPALGGSTAIDGFSAMIPVWMNAGDTITLAAAVSGLTGTNYSLYAVVGRML